MTAPAEVVEPILAACPEFQVVAIGDDCALTVDSGDVSGALCLTHESLPDFLMAWQWFRDRQKTSQPRCRCGESLTSHDITTKRKPCSRHGCPCTAFEPREAVARDHCPA